MYEFGKKIECSYNNSCPLLWLQRERNLQFVCSACKGMQKFVSPSLKQTTFQAQMGGGSFRGVGGCWVTSRDEVREGL